MNTAIKRGPGTAGLRHRRRWLANMLAMAAGLLGVGRSVAGAAHPSNASTVIRVGQSLPLTGPLAAVMAPVAQGQAALLEDVNRGGGVHGKRVELLALDDAQDVQRTLENFSALVEKHGVPVLFGMVNSSALEPVMALLERQRTPLIGIYNGADAARTAHHPYLFTTTASIRDEIQQMLRTLSTLQYRRVAVAFQDTKFGRWLLPLVESIAMEHGVSVVEQQALEVQGGNAVEAVHTLARSDAQALLLLAAGPSVAALVKEARNTIRVPIYALSIAATGSMIQQLGPLARGMAVTQIVPFPWRQTLPLVRSFHTSMARAKLEPSYDRLWGYLNATILVEALRRAGPNPDAASIVGAMESMTDVDLGGYRLRYGPQQHHGSHFVEITMVDARGEYVR